MLYKMDRNDPEAGTEINDGKQVQQQQQQQQRLLAQNEVVPPSSQTSPAATAIETTKSDRVPQIKKQSKSSPALVGANIKKKSTSIDLDDNNKKNFAAVKSESDTESESQLFAKNETKTIEKDNESYVNLENGGGTSMTSTIKRKLSVSEDDDDYDEDDDDDDGSDLNGSDDEEDFAGFDAEDKNKGRVLLPLVKRLKLDESSDITSPLPKSYKSPRRSTSRNDSAQNKHEFEDDAKNVSINDTKKIVAGPSSSVASTTTMLASNVEKEKPAHIITTDPRYRNPFKYGWRREVVFRANVEGRLKLENKGEVYYHAPNGKKLRTKADIIAVLRHDQIPDLDIGDFTFAKESIGMPADQEIVRSAKVQTPSQRKQPSIFADNSVSPDNYSLLGKRVPKPKMPKGASPPTTPTPSTLNKSRVSNAIAKRVPETTEVIQPKIAKSNSKSNREPCTIQCVLAMGTIPQLLCKKCLCLYHHECVGLEKYDGPVANYICECCVREKAADQNQSSTSANLMSGDANTAMQVAGPSSIANANDNQNGAGITTDQLTSALRQKDRKNSTGNASTNNNNNNTRMTNALNVTTSQQTNNKQPQHSTTKDEGSVIGSMTAWVPSTASLTQSKALFNNQGDVKTTPPQTVAIVAGRKYIMVPKTNMMSISPSGVDTINGSSSTSAGTISNAINSSRSLTPVVGVKSMSTTSEDTAPVKRKTLSRSGSVKAISGIGGGTSSSSSASNAYAATPASVHTLFASEFFSNVSRGYDILFHTFQYLKVQELLRASCVCRMWNHVANNSILWKTVRMKNSQANDWGGLMATLRRHGTSHLDLRKILIPPKLNWKEFAQHITTVPDLETLDLGRCPAEVVASLLETNSNLRTLNALSIIGETISLPLSSKLLDLTELRLKSVQSESISVESLQGLRKLTKLRHLSLTSLNGLDANNLEALGALTALESLELGDCNNLTGPFAKNVLIKLRQLERLRLEKGQERCCTFEILDVLDKLQKLTQLELVNFDIKTGFDTRIAQCKRLQRILLIPTYISQSATTNNIVLSSISLLGDTMHAITWVVTQELIRVTELYTDEYDNEGQERRPMEDKIPIIKPVPLMTKDAIKSINANTETNAQLVEILPLHQVEKMIKTAIPNLKLKIVKVPFSATWRQTISES